MKGLHHAGFTVSDIDRSMEFYHNMPGLEFGCEPAGWFSGEGLDKAVGVSDTELRLVSFKVGQDHIELLQYYVG